ncbi:MAG: protein kinase [Isosphaeraceae bacterium]
MPSRCPDPQQLNDLIAGQLDPADWDRLSRHVDDCPSCQARVEAIDATPLPHLAVEVATAAAAEPTSSAFAGEAECRAVLERLEATDPVSFGRAGRAGEDSGRPTHAGHYELRDEVGRGGMGVVYRAWDARLNRLVAVKMIRRDVLPTAEDVRRFRGEAAAAAGLDHPNIVPIYEVGGDDAAPFFAMALVEGQTLGELVAEGPLPPNVAAAHIRAVALAVAYAHERGIVHRDLKPANLLLDSGGIPRVSDFGLAKRTEMASDLTGTGLILGTPSFMPPEQAHGDSQQIGPRSDLYALGATLYCLVTGRPPFQAASKLEVLRQVIERDPVPPRQLNRAVPRDLETIILKCLEKNPAQRYHDAGELADDLGRCLEGRPIQARPVGVVGTLARSVRRKPLVAALAFSLAVVAVGGLAGILWQWREADLRARAERWERYRAEMRAASSLIEAVNVAPARAALEHAPSEHRGWEWRYLNRQLDLASRTLSGHTGAVFRAVFSPDGSRLVTSSGDASVLVWNVSSGQRLATLVGPGKNTHLIHFMDSEHLLGAAEDHTLRLWDLTRPPGQQSTTLFGPEPINPWTSLSGNGKFLATWHSDGSARIRNATTSSLVATLEKGGPFASCLAVSHDGTLVAGGIEDGSILLRGTDGSSRKLAGDVCPAHSLAFHPSGRWLVAGFVYPADTVVLYDLTTNQRVFTSKGHGNEVSLVRFSPDGSTIASASIDQSARLWDVPSGRLRAVLRGHNAPLTDLAFSPDGTRLVTTAQDEVPRLWDTATGELVAALGGHTGMIHSASFSPDGRLIATASADQTVRLWDTAALERNGILRGHESFAYSVAWTADNQRLLSCGWDRTVRLWDPSAERELARRSFSTIIVPVLTLSRDGRQLAVVHDDNKIDVLASDLQGPAITLGQPTNFWRRKPTLAFDPDGTHLFAGSENAAYRWDLQTRTREAFACSSPSWHAAVALSPDGRTLASGGEDGHIDLYEVSTRQHRATLRGHGSLVTSLAFSPDGVLLASASEDATARIWDVPTQTERAVMSHGSIVHGLAFSPDHTRLATACGDNTIGIWDLAHFVRLIELRGHRAYVHAVAFSPDGSRLASASGDHTVRIWNTQPHQAAGPQP